VRFSLVPSRLLIDIFRCPLPRMLLFHAFSLPYRPLTKQFEKTQHFAPFVPPHIWRFFHDFPVISYFRLSFTFTFPSLLTFARFFWRYATSFQRLPLSKHNPPDVPYRCRHIWRYAQLVLTYFVSHQFQANYDGIESRNPERHLLFSSCLWIGSVQQSSPISNANSMKSPGRAVT
jgi:hypothetical protein